MEPLERNTSDLSQCDICAHIKEVFDAAGEDITTDKAASIFKQLRSKRVVKYIKSEGLYRGRDWQE